jgi:quinol monooxygenase YgiN
VLIVAGRLQVRPEQRDEYVARCIEIVQAARRSPGCLDFSITADSLDPAIVRVYERWASEEQLHAFRGAGPSNDQQDQILDADVKEYVVS